MAYLALFLLATWLSAAAIGESLWLDELHTSWSISGSWGEIAERAQAGNQSPLYFWVVAAVSQTLGGFSRQIRDVSASAGQFAWPELLLRLPSILAWMACVGLLGRHLHHECQRRHLSQLLVPGMLLWLVVDRIQWFYSTEARPYALVQLASLAGWGCIAAIFVNPSRTAPLGSNFLACVGWMVAWTLLAIISLNLHLTAGLSVLTQWFTGGLFWLLHRPNLSHEPSLAANGGTAWRVGFAWLLASLLVAVACLPLLQLAAPVWQKRALWASFASDVSPLAVVTIFPLLPILLPVLGARLVERVCAGWGNQPTANETAVDSGEWKLQWLWWLALVGPWLLAWGITASGVAPLFHRRFVIASAIPLVIVAADQMLRLRSNRLRILALGAIVAALLVTQGTAQQWRHGKLVGWLRGEDWRAAARWLSDQIAADEVVYCASGLIEANSLEPPLDVEVAEYLAFPLTGAYDIRLRGVRVHIDALVNNPKVWEKQLFTADLPPKSSPAAMWLVYRGSRQRLQTKLRVLNESLGAKRVRVTEERSFGAVQVIRLNLGVGP